METTLTIPDGFELKQTDEKHFEIVKKEEPVEVHNTEFVPQQCNEYGDIGEIEQAQMQNVVDNRPRLEQIQQPSDGTRDDNFDRMLENNSYFHELYKNGKIEKLNNDEMNLLRFCHNTDMRAFLKEEFEKHPIDYSVFDVDKGGGDYCPYI